MTHYILDCDPGHDDAVALLMAGRYLDLVGVTTVFGNSTVENTTRNALAILDAAGLGHIPVAAGADKPLAGKTHSAEAVHGKSGLDGANFPASQNHAIAMSAPEFIAEQAERYGDLVVIAVAPETNVALALQQYPGIKNRISGISIMGGSTSFGNATAAAEFNVFADPEAAAVVFASGIPITMSGLNVTARFGLDRDQLNRLSNNGTLVAHELAGALGFYLGRQDVMYERQFAPLHDVCAVLPFSHPGLIEYEPMHVVVECEGRFTRGMTLCDLRGIVAGEGVEMSQPPNARVAVKVDEDVIKTLILDTLCEFP